MTKNSNRNAAQEILDESKQTNFWHKYSKRCKINGDFQEVQDNIY